MSSRLGEAFLCAAWRLLRSAAVWDTLGAMPDNAYDDPDFFDRYSRMPRSVHGLDGAGEWHASRKLFPDLATYLDTLIRAGFAITAVVEPDPDPALLRTVPDMRDELRRPMMLLVAARKPAP